MATIAAPTHDRLVEAALDLFVRQGFEETSVGQIEAAAGLVLSNHFESKEALLTAAVDRHVAMLDQISALMDAGPLALELREELTLLARWVIAEHQREDTLLRFLQRDGDRFPELAALVRDHIVERGYRQAEQWLRKRIEDGGFPDYDAEAVTVVALGSLVAYDAQRTMLGAPPLGVDEDRFVAMWVEAWMRVATSAVVERDDSRS